MKSMIIKEFRELTRDRRTMAMLVVLPILLLVIFGYAANFSVGTQRTVVIGPQAEVARTPEQVAHGRVDLDRRASGID